jgi:hypothetical protein
MLNDNHAITFQSIWHKKEAAGGVVVVYLKTYDS